VRELPRGTVTFLFTDIEGSTRLLDELGAEAYSAALAEHRRVLREAFERQGGVEVDTQGDAFFVAFPTAPGALEAARESQAELELPVRMGLHTGTPLLTEEGYVGADVHRAARIAAAGHGRQVLLSEATRALVHEDVHDLGRHRLKDFDEAVAIFQLGQERFPPLKTISNTNLPRPVSSFVGREREVAEVASLLRSGLRLVTLSGPGGSGKTRLAIEAASESVGDFPEGVFWVGLVTVRTPDLVTETIAQTLGAKDDLAGYIGAKRLLLVLDNLEQVIDAAQGLAALLGACPNLQVLTTSRELLRVQGEHDYAVPPLTSSEAVVLFCARAQLEPEPPIPELCARLDNLPLALELAAARTRAVEPAQLLERLAQRLDLLKGGRDSDPRQQTLRATIEWSHDLLTREEQQLFARLAVFIGGCTLEAAERVVGAELDTLQSLVDKSLVRASNRRYWMLETIREFAAERLEESDDAGALERRHCEFFLDLAEEIELRSRREEQAPLFERLDAENANLRQAVDWTRGQGESVLELRFALALWVYWYARGYISEGRRWIEDALARADDRPARAVLGLSMLRQLAGEKAAESLELAKEALQACEEAGDDYSIAQAWNLIGQLEASGLGHVTSGENAFLRALEHAERGDYPGEKADSMGWLMVMSIFGLLPTDQGIERCKDFFDRAGKDEKVRAFALCERAVLEAMRGDFDLARKLFAEGHQRFRSLGLNVWAANNAQEYFFVEMLAGNPAGAAAMLRASHEEFEQMGERGFNSTIAGMLAHALHAQGLDDEAEHFSRECERLAASDDAYSQALWRSALAKVHADRGQHDRAEALAREALEILPADMLMMVSDASFDLAAVLAAGGQKAEAKAAAEEAARLYERKGNLVALERARRLAAELA
jgi:predicted ATPase